MFLSPVCNLTWHYAKISAALTCLTERFSRTKATWSRRYFLEQKFPLKNTLALLDIPTLSELVWLCLAQDQASSRIEAALKGSGSELQQLAQLLTGQRLAAAVSLASASGDIRLAMLICQVTEPPEFCDLRTHLQKLLAPTACPDVLCHP